MKLLLQRLLKEPIWPAPRLSLYQEDWDFQSLYHRAQAATQMSASDNTLRQQRHYLLQQLCQQAPTERGHIAECGTWRGMSAFQIATILEQKECSKDFFIFDSFQGLSDFQDEDLNEHSPSDINSSRSQFACPIEIVKDNLQAFPLIKYKVGWIPAKFQDVEDLQFSFVHIDLDLYQPIKESLMFFYPRMVKGGIIVLDDYGYLPFPGAKKATEAFLADKPDFFLSCASGSAFIIKS